ncbi:MAG: hypothetical protein SGCHY_002248 [Lobulomycetales sp.]
MQWIFWSASSGLLAALSTCIGKLISASAWADSQMLVYPSLVALGLCNVAMWFTFTRALAASPNSILPSAANSSANLLCSGLLGALLFGERVSLLWGVGVLLIAGGSFMIINDTSPAEQASGNDAQKKQR